MRPAHVLAPGMAKALTLPLALVLTLALAASPALAQHAHHHGQHEPTAPASPLPAAPAAPSAADPHAGHAMPAAPLATDDHAGHTGHAGHAPDLPDPPVSPPPPAAFSGPAHAADARFGAPSMAAARKLLRREHGGMASHKIFIDQLEAMTGDGGDGYAWQGEAWYGGDIDRLWLKTEGEGRFKGGADAEVQVLWSHAIGPWFNLQGGLRQDLGDGPERTHAVVGVKGLAPYWIELDAALFLSDRGDLTARIEAEYDLRLTRRLILQPRAEIALAAQDMRASGIGSGLSSAEAELRLRYEIVPDFAPYVGVTYESAFGRTSRLRRAAGDRTHGAALVFGLRTWF